MRAFYLFMVLFWCQGYGLVKGFGYSLVRGEGKVYFIGKGKGKGWGYGKEQNQVEV